MRILALDTATESCSAAALLDGRLIARERLLERGHAECILTMIDEVLDEAAVGLTALTAVAFGRGPGSFTGVRLAASIAQGLAYGAGVPVVAVSDLAAVAQRVLREDEGALRVLVCNDARMREVYWGCFERSAAGLAAPVGGEHVGAPATVSLPAQWPRGAGSCGAGSGFAAYPPLRAAFAGALTAIIEMRPRAEEIALLAVAEAAAGRLLDAEQALPLYLRDDVVQSPPRTSN
ncbi:MAG TPA: tRNA (adenosine(37)-N6)-threonylcarbamoyltransferase complex dimerization subunit type 1 TsaB [Steroidobacteraceae bacterium]|nr:tRNA (adenosine(37)-N6)-threonylcarbamoyltransferase complex dimerization subunit type 1 TsaB [Steroidobacteraceae bacterium]